MKKEYTKKANKIKQEKVDLGKSLSNEDKIIKVHISNLRNKLKEYDSFEYIETVWNMGYKLNFKKG